MKRNGKSSEVEAERTYSLKLSVIVDKYFYHREPADVFAYLQPDYEIDKRRIEDNLLWRELHSRRKFAKESYIGHAEEPPALRRNCSELDVPNRGSSELMSELSGTSSDGRALSYLTSNL